MNVDTLKKAKELLDAGIITPEEFEAIKQKEMNTVLGASAGGGQPAATPVQAQPVVNPAQPQPVVTPVQPAATPVQAQPVVTPVQPAVSPAQPSATPVQPAATPAQPQPVVTPVQPAATPAQPQPVVTPVQPAATPAQPQPVVTPLAQATNPIQEKKKSKAPLFIGIGVALLLIVAAVLFVSNSKGKDMIVGEWSSYAAGDVTVYSDGTYEWEVIDTFDGTWKYDRENSNPSNNFYVYDLTIEGASGAIGYVYYDDDDITLEIDFGGNEYNFWKYD